jgi:hypothetical protein
LVAQQLILGDNSKAVSLDKLLGELLAALSAEHKSRYQGDPNRDGLGVQILETIQGEIDDIRLGQTSADLVHLSLVDLLVEGDVEDLQDLDDHLLGHLIASSALVWPLFN